MRKHFSLSLLGGCLLCGAVSGPAAHATEPLVLYDNFNAVLITPDKWFGTEIGAASREAIRELELGKLRLLAISYGGTESNSERRHERLRLNFTHPDAVTEIAATVQVASEQVAGCTANPLNTTVAARMGGVFFNSGTPLPGNPLNDVAAFIDVERRSDAPHPADPSHVVAVVRHCTAVDQDEDCAGSDQLFAQDLGPIAVGKTVGLTLRWDQPHHQFLFQRDSQPVVSFAYLLADTGHPDRPGKRLAVAEEVANCTATPRPVALLEAFFNHVCVNASAAPSGAPACK